MTNAQCDALRHAVFTSRRTLLAAALALAAQRGGTPASEAKKKRKKRKRQRKPTCGAAGTSPIKGQCCAGATAVDGVCQACHVCASGCRFSTVQGAINAANAGDTIVICPGTYVENVTITRDVRLIGRDAGAGASASTLRGTGAGPVVTVKTGLVALERLHITGGRGDGGGISNLGATLGLSGCTVSGNSDLGASGGGIYNTGALILNGSTVSQNAAAEGGGIFNTGGNAEVQVINSEIRGNRANNGGGIYAHEGANVLVDAGSRVTANFAEREGGGIFASLTAGRVELVSRDSVIANIPSNCEGAPVDFCSNEMAR
jgi:hypothetical protein